MSKRDEVVVSISCITYNHVSYIAQCLDGFLMQKTTFKFEVLIHDDASTDGTQDIIKEYQLKYPDIIKPIIQKENQYSQGYRGFNAKYNYSRAKGKYIALCEGDDYWIDPYKLQKQVDFLEQNPDYSMCFHNAIEYWEDQSKDNRVFSKIENRDYGISEIYEKWIIPTASVLFRKKVVESEFYIQNISKNPSIIYGDIALFLSCCLFGKIRGQKDVMSVYRRHMGGLVYNVSFKRDLKQSIHDLELCRLFNNISNIAHKYVFCRSLRCALICLFLNEKSFSRLHYKLMLKVFRPYFLIFVPRTVYSFIRNYSKYKDSIL